jgi:sodium pump decarboxylase gamma subunit
MNLMLVQGFTLMVAGMGVVILFLSLMVLVMQGSGAFFRKHGERFREPVEAENRMEQISTDDSEAIAVVVASLTAYLKR